MTKAPVIRTRCHEKKIHKANWEVIRAENIREALNLIVWPFKMSISLLPLCKILVRTVSKRQLAYFPKGASVLDGQTVSVCVFIGFICLTTVIKVLQKKKLWQAFLEKLTRISEFMWLNKSNSSSSICDKAWLERMKRVASTLKK